MIPNAARAVIREVEQVINNVEEAVGIAPSFPSSKTPAAEPVQPVPTTPEQSE